MSTFPYSKLTAEAKADADKWAASDWMTFCKPVLEDFQRIAIGKFSDIDAMLAAGWLVIDRTR